MAKRFEQRQVHTFTFRCTAIKAAIKEKRFLGNEKVS